MDKIDFKKQFKHLYGATKKPALLDMPVLNFVMVKVKEK